MRSSEVAGPPPKYKSQKARLLESAASAPSKPRPLESASGIRGPPPVGALLLSRIQVLDLLNVSSVTLWSWMRRGAFPLAIMLGPPEGKRSKIAWRADEVYAWLAARPRRELRPPTIKDEPRKHRRTAR